MEMRCKDGRKMKPRKNTYAQSQRAITFSAKPHKVESPIKKV
jgi:hypothetical protein